MSDRMMNYSIIHETHYTFSKKVFLEPHIFRFRPRAVPHTILGEFDLQIHPEPSGQSEQMDIEGNQIVNAWFENIQLELKIRSTATIEVREVNPFNFLVHPPEFLTLPFRYSHQDQILLAPALTTFKLPVEMKAFVDSLMVDTENQSIAFLTALNSKIFEEFALESRELGSPLDPVITFNRRHGSCRDLAWMQIHMLRQVNIATRFVSGYFYPDSVDPDFELHAWIEAYIPGAGWIGFDPGHGILIGSRHIPVAASVLYENTMPVTGSFRGNAESLLKTDLRISLNR